MPRGDAREKLRSKGVSFDRPITCPAGQAFSSVMLGPGCFCRIEQSEITAVDQPSTLALHCQGSYETCGTWRAAKEAYWEDREVIREYAPRPRQTVLDEDPERRPEFSVRR